MPQGLFFMKQNVAKVEEFTPKRIDMLHIVSYC
jgi:hypothetical protein